MSTEGHRFHPKHNIGSVDASLYLIERVALKHDVSNIGKHDVIVFKGAWASQRF
jgi:hypothetical protein